jgi:hypothetical protein
LDTIERVLELGDKAAAVVGLVRVTLCGSRGGQTKKIYRKMKSKSNKSSTLRKAKLNKKVIMLARTTCDEQGLGQGSVGEGCCRCLSTAMEAKAGDNPQQRNPKPQEARKHPE